MSRLSALRRRIALWLCPELREEEMPDFAAGVIARSGINLPTDDAVAKLVRLAKAFGEARGWKLSTVSLRIANHGDLLPDLASGKRRNITIARYERIVSAISAKWPANLPWPTDIPRPKPVPEAAE